jgi:hypothetical protein
MRLIAQCLLLGAALAAAIAWAAQSGVVLRSEELRAEPFLDAKVIAPIAKDARVEVLRQQGAWSQAHRWWLGQQTFERMAERVMFEDYLLAVEQTEARRRSLELHLGEVAREPRYAEAVGWLRCFQGIDTITVITLLAELHDFRRFRSPSQLMAYLGLVPSEYSSGTHQHRGAITRTGNRHVRRLLVEAAWHYRHKPRVGIRVAQRATASW